MRAFTLAEVLITLGIIGVVAAMTIPGLINKIQDRHNIAHWRKTYATVYDAYKRVLDRDISPCRFTNCGLDHTKGESKYGNIYFQFSDDFVDAFMEELNISDKCFNFPMAPFCSTSHFGIGKNKGYSLMYKPKVSYSIDGRMRLLLKDGSVLILQGSHGGPWIGVDVNGPSSKPNQLGRDLFLIKVYEDKILPLGAQGTFNTSKNGTECKCGKNFGLQTYSSFLAGPEGQGVIPSGGCCSAYFLKYYK